MLKEASLAKSDVQPLGFRDLTPEELELIAGGYWTDGYGNGEIVVGGGRGGGTGGGNYGPPGGGTGGWTWGGGSSGSSSGISYPSSFDVNLDISIDQFVENVASQIQAMPDVDKIEYLAAVWIDSSGNLHVTSIEKGAKTSAEFDKIWNQIDFNNGGKVVAYIHSHPTLYNATSNTNPTWLPVANSEKLSAPDFDELMRVSSGDAGYGFDADNFRSYIVSGGQTHEYYGFQQDSSRVGGNGQATWSISSTDYSSNTAG